MQLQVALSGPVAAESLATRTLTRAAAVLVAVRVRSTTQSKRSQDAAAQVNGVLLLNMLVNVLPRGHGEPRARVHANGLSLSSLCMRQAQRLRQAMRRVLGKCWRLSVATTSSLQQTVRAPLGVAARALLCRHRHVCARHMFKLLGHTARRGARLTPP